MKLFKRIFKNQKTTLIILFMLAVTLRIAGPYLKEIIVFHKSFIYSGDELYKNSEYDEIIYNYTAKALFKGRGFAINYGELEENVNFSDIKEKLPNFTEILVSLGQTNKTDVDYLHHKLVPPLYPLFLVLCYYLFGVSTFAYFIPQIILGSLSCLLIYFIAKRIFNDSVALLAGFAVALYPDLILWTYMIRVETLFIFLLVFAFWLLLKGKSSSNNYLVLGGGFMLGLACLTRMTILFFLPIIILWQYLILSDKKQTLIKALILILIFIALLLPWAVRNYLVFNDFTVIPSEAGTIFFDYIDRSNISSPVEFSFLKYFNHISQNSIKFSLISFKRFIKFIAPITPPMNTFAKIYKSITWLAVFPLSLSGLFLATGRAWKENSLSILFIIYYILLHTFTYVDDGLIYRYPIQPFLCIYASYGLFALLNIGKMKSLIKNNE